MKIKTSKISIVLVLVTGTLFFASACADTGNKSVSYEEPESAVVKEELVNPGLETLSEIVGAKETNVSSEFPDGPGMENIKKEIEKRQSQESSENIPDGPGVENLKKEIERRLNSVD